MTRVATNGPKGPQVKIALFGGSFNPPHLAHRQVVEYLKDLPDFDAVWIVPTFDHPFQKELASYPHRRRMCELDFAGLGPKVKISDIEKELKARPSYMINTLRALKKKNPDCQFAVVVGSDCREEMAEWKDPEALKREAAFLFVPRPGFENSPFMDISSSRIRELIKAGKPVTKYLAPEVVEYIEKNGLYKTWVCI
ncbi:MAG: nicotinate (nicotinamide) nucleotide adenylyltransferase [Deltaproteobacteria bacterium]|nr:nicotinate (nicotinamide) nucleotide adenylyltransferase [Deltaproteobacteria bacterium]